MPDICVTAAIAGGLIGGASLPAFYQHHVFKWVTDESMRLRKEQRELAVRYEGKTSPDDVEGFLEDAKSAVKEAKRRARGNGRLIGANYRRALLKSWDRVDEYLERLGHSENHEEVHYKLSNLFEEMNREKKEALEKKRAALKARREAQRKARLRKTA